MFFGIVIVMRAAPVPALSSNRVLVRADLALLIQQVGPNAGLPIVASRRLCVFATCYPTALVK